MKVLIANPKGFCAGVERAINTVDLVIEKYKDKKIFVLHEIVHNKRVIADFKSRGVNFVEDIKDVKSGSVLVFSAHGVSKIVEDAAKSKDLIIVNATCPLVTKVHKEAILYQSKNKQIIIIGNKNHPEVIGTIGRVDCKIYIVESAEDIKSLDIVPDSDIAYITQTTLSVDYTKNIIAKLKQKFPKIVGNSDICYATQNRQDAVKALANNVDLMLIIGSSNSSNSKNLNNVAKMICKNSYLINSYLDVDKNWFLGAKSIGISSGASAPEVLVKELIEFLQTAFKNLEIRNFDFKTENVKFSLPVI